MQRGYTKTPNILFDKLLKDLTYSELKILLVIIRQTYGWKKKRDRITYSQFQKKTGLSRRIISETIKSLTNKNLILITDTKGNILSTPKDRQGRYFLYYSFHLPTSAKDDQNMCTLEHEHVQNMEYDKRNYNKRNKTKGENVEHVSKILAEMKTKWKIKITEDKDLSGINHSQ